MSYNKLKYPAFEGHSIPELFGLTRASKLPVDGLVPRFVNGIYIWVNSNELSKNRSTHRAMSNCPKCSKIVPIGRLAQHAKVHK